jgi:hypothetical protein
MPGDKKRAIEREEIKKGALVLLTGQHFAGYGAVTEDAQPYGYPELRIPAATEQGSYVQFFEQCFEWEEMMYFFYPYFWGRKDQWIENSTASDSDPLFETFLRAGSVRAVLPVRPNYGKALAYYLTFGEPWNGGEAPILDDELYVAIVDEIADAQDASLADAVPYGDPWTYTQPTELVKLQDDSTLPTFEPAG